MARFNLTEDGRQFLSERSSQADSGGRYDCFAEKPAELIELWRTLTELNDAVTQVARGGNLPQANHVREMLAQVKREVYKLLSEE